MPLTPEQAALLSSADLEVRWLRAQSGITSPASLDDLQRAVHTPDEFTYFSALSGLTPASQYSLADHKRVVYASTWTTVRTNLFTNTRAVSNVGFGAASQGATELVTDFPGDIATARKWTDATQALARIAVLELGLDTPGPGSRAHVMVRFRIGVASLNAVSLSVRPNSTASALGQTLVDFGNLAPGVYERELDSALSATAVTSSGGVVLLGTPTAPGVTVEYTRLLVEKDTTGPFFDGNTAAGAGEQNIWQGTPLLSKSEQQRRSAGLKTLTELARDYWALNV